MAFSVLRFCARSVFADKNAMKRVLSTKHVTNARRLTECLPCPIQRINCTPTAMNYSKHTERQPEKKFSSDSESDSDLDEDTGHRGESTFWRRKMRTFHGIIDVNKDGVISFDDFKLLADRFVRLGHMSQQHAREFHEVIGKLWEMQWGEVSPYNLVTVEQYLEDMHHVLNDKERVRKVHSFLPYLFKAVDKDKSGLLSVEEFKLFFKCLGLQDEDAVFTFRIVDTNADGKITSKEFVKLGRDFFLTEDETKISKYFWGPLDEN